MNIVFAGTPEFALPALDALLNAGHQIVAVYTQPDRPAGRGRKLQATAVAARAQTLKLPVRTPEKFNADAVAELRGLAPDAMVVVAYGLLLPQTVLDIPRHGCFNIHASLLPRWRGAAPIQRAIMAGDRETGVTIMRMDAGLDTGSTLLQEKVAIGEQTAGELQDALAKLGARLMVESLEKLERGKLSETAQPAQGATYAKKISKDEARLDWQRPATELARQVRAFNPAPVAWTELDGERIRLFRAVEVPLAHGARPGCILAADADGIRVASGSGALRIELLQRPGGIRLAAAQAVRGWNLAGKHFR